MENFLFGILKLKAEDAIGRSLDSLNTPEPLLSAIKYAVEGGGKRVRPLLAMLGARIGGGNEEMALPYAVAIEFVHSYSLIHDDLPCMDNDDFRRGKPTVHKQFGESIAVLAGDALLNLAFETLADAVENATDKARAAKAFGEIAKCAGASGMIKGQILDISSYPSKPGEVNRYKTCALLSGALLSGAIAGGASEGLQESLRDYAENLGQAFQIADDIMDYDEGERNAANYVVVYGREAAEEAVRQHSYAAEAAIKPYGRHEELVDFAAMLSKRKK